ncbi:MAG: hypothetical protein IKY30_03245 [Oscillospiraceae bacterium]|nr:hypothetical protein [Oscillospiraceae bacterium]
MKCPYCGKDMEKGIIYNKLQVKWQDESSILFPKTVNLSEMGLLGGKAVSWLCEDCKKVIIDYSDIQQD